MRSRRVCPSVRPSVRPSVTHKLNFWEISWIKTKWHQQYETRLFTRFKVKSEGRLPERIWCLNSARLVFLSAAWWLFIIPAPVCCLFFQSLHSTTFEPSYSLQVERNPTEYCRRRCYQRGRRRRLLQRRQNCCYCCCCWGASMLVSFPRNLFSAKISDYQPIKKRGIERRGGKKMKQSRKKVTIQF